VLVPPAAQTPPIAAKGEQWALVPSGENEVRIMFKAMTNVELTGEGKRSLPSPATEGSEVERHVMQQAPHSARVLLCRAMHSETRRHQARTE
jgi:hypothetical protein